MSSLGLLRRRSAMQNIPKKGIDVVLYDNITLSDGAEILLHDILFLDHTIELKVTFSNTQQQQAVLGVDVGTGASYVLAKTNTGSYKGVSNGKTSPSQYFLSGWNNLVHRWTMTDVIVNGESRLAQERTSREWILKLVSGNSYTIFSYVDIYDSSGVGLLHSLRPALVNGEIVCLFDEITKSYYPMTSESGTIKLS